MRRPAFPCACRTSSIIVNCRQASGLSRWGGAQARRLPRYEETMETPWKPTKEQVQAAAGKSVPDVIAPGLRVLFVGINPGLYTAAIGHHFGRPGNRFWPTLHAAGFTARLLSPFEEHELLKSGYGITNLVERATATAAELSVEELRARGPRARG